MAKLYQMWNVESNLARCDCVMVIDRKDMYVYMMRSLRKESGSPNLINHRPNSLKLLGLLHVDSNAHVKVGVP